MAKKDEFKQFRPNLEQEGTLPLERLGANTIFKEGNFQSPRYKQDESGWRLSSEGSAEFQSLNIRGIDIGVKPGGSIQDAIDQVNSNGGGIVRLSSGTYSLTASIDVKSNVQLIGAGVGNTILEFNDTSGYISSIGTSSSIRSNFGVSGMTIQNSTATAAIDIDYGDYWYIENVRVTSCNNSGVRWKHTQHFRVVNVTSDNNGAQGFISLGGEGTRPVNYFFMSNLVAEDNTGDGFEFTQDDTGGNGHAYGQVLSCRSEDNGAKGFEVGYCNMRIIGCSATNNTGDGFEFDADNSYVISCDASLNGGYGFQMLQQTDVISMVDVFSYANTSGNYDIPAGSFTNILGSSTQSGTSYTNTVDRRIEKMQNTSGGALSAGNVVILKATATGNEITTTTTGGDDMVWGVLMNSASSNGVAIVLTKGFTNLLKVDGTTDIAVGDLLCTFTSAGIAAKATTGDMAFAVALEAYTSDDSNGVIDALIISPRKL